MLEPRVGGLGLAEHLAVRQSEEGRVGVGHHAEDERSPRDVGRAHELFDLTGQRLLLDLESGRLAVELGGLERL